MSLPGLGLPAGLAPGNTAPVSEGDPVGTSRLSLSLWPAFLCRSGEKVPENSIWVYKRAVMRRLELFIHIRVTIRP